MIGNRIQRLLIARYASRHGMTAEAAARVWIVRHAGAFGRWFCRHRPA